MSKHRFPFKKTHSPDAAPAPQAARADERLRGVQLRPKRSLHTVWENSKTHKYSPLDSAVESLRLYGGKLESVANLLTDPALAAWLRHQRLAETANDKHARARVDSEFMKELGIPETVRVAVLQETHYGGLPMQFTARVVIGDIGRAILDRAQAHEDWIRESPERLVKHLKTFPKLPQNDLR